MKISTFIFFFLLSLPALAQNAPQPIEPTLIQISPMQSSNSPIVSDGKLNRFYMNVYKANKADTAGFVRDNSGTYEWNTANPWSISQGFTGHPGWQQAQSLSTLEGTEMFPRFEIATTTPVTALSSLGYLLTANGQRYRIFVGGGGGVGGVPTPEKWGSSVVGNSIDEFKPSKRVIKDGKELIYLWAPTQILGSLSAGKLFSDGAEREFGYTYSLAAWHENTGVDTELRSKVTGGDQTAQLKKGELIKLPNSAATLWDVGSIADGRRVFPPGRYSVSLNVEAEPKKATEPYGGSGGTDSATVFVLGGNLGVVTVAGTQLPETEEETPGAFVALNNDNDDYTFDTAGDALVDSGKSDATPGENDMVAVQIDAIQPLEMGGKYTLDFGAGIKIWRNATKTDPSPDVPGDDETQGNQAEVISSQTEFDATKSVTLYIEGIAKGSATLNLDWKNTPLEGETAIEAKAMDTVKITVYEVTGPTNVPGFARYTYKADGTGLTTPGTWTAQSGSVQIPNTVPGAAPNTFTTVTSSSGNTSQILWSGGPVIGFAVYKPNDNFECRRDVNVVQIDLDVDGSSVEIRNPPVQNDNRIFSVGNGFAMSATLTVKRAEGPSRNGKERGLRYIQLGFIQVLRVAKWHGDYQFGGANAQERYATVNGEAFEGKEGLDGNTAGIWPWYDSPSFNSGNGYMAYSQLQDLNVGDQRDLNIPFRARDTPYLPGVDAFSLSLNGQFADARRFDMRLEFQLFFAVNTHEEINDSEAIYTQRASVNWHFDGSGPVSAKIWQSDGGNGSSNDRFTSVTNGVVVPYTAKGNPQENSFFNVFVQPIESFKWRSQID